MIDNDDRQPASLQESDLAGGNERIPEPLINIIRIITVEISICRISALYILLFCDIMVLVCYGGAVMPNLIRDYPDALHTLNDAMHFAESRTTFEINKTMLFTPGDEARDVYLVALRGTNSSWDKNDVLSIPVCLRTFLNLKNIYFNEVKEAIINTVPCGASLVLVGHSLGGMILQQISADKEINKKYILLNLLNIGSPFVRTIGRKCSFRRVVDRADIVPWLGFSVVANIFTHKPVFKSNGYFGNPLGAHTDSYRMSRAWLDYDCFGIYKGGNVIVFLH